MDSSERDAMHGFHNSSSEKVVKLKPASATSLNITKVFLYVFGGLLITTIVAIGVGLALSTVYKNSPAQADSILRGIMIGAGIALLIDVIYMNLVTLKGKHTIMAPAVIYAVLVGLLFSTFVLFIPWEIIGMAFGITCLAFALMSLIAFLSKGNLSPLLVCGIAILGGAGFLALFNLIYQLASGTGFNMINWIVSFALFAFFMLVTIFDLWNMKKIAERGEMSNNVTLYCAFSLYVDFINIFIRVLFYLLIIFGGRR